MYRRQFSREFKLEAASLVKDRGVSVAQAARDRDLHENALRKNGPGMRAVIRGMPDRTIALQCLMASVENARKLRLVTLDACRNNPVAVGG